MSKTNSNDATNRAITTAIPDAWEIVPCVQYGFPGDTGPTRAPKLRTIFEPTPVAAETVSPVYLLNRDQYERQNELESGYQVKGCTSIATELQNECEAADSVLYPVHIESDAYHDGDPARLIEWFRKFITEYLGVSFATCTLYFSGRRSIHTHVPRFAADEDQREQLGDLAETFCEETGADLDCGLYDAKRMFRLPGVEHAKTGLPKVEIEAEWGHDRIFQETNDASSSVPESYESVLRSVFATQPSLTVKSPQTSLEPPYDLFKVLDSEKTVLEVPSNEQESAVPLIEQEQYPSDASDIAEWARYNTKEFSPYALASGNKRSVAVLKVKGEAFARSDVQDGTTLIPAYFYGAQGCVGEAFTKTDEHAPLQLSKPDYEKWTHEVGDNVAIIGGKSHQSRILSLEPWQATIAGHALTGDGASRQDALSYLESEGYDVGAAGVSESAAPAETTNSHERADHVQPVQNPRTDAAALQQQAEQDGIETLTHMERWRVACRVLGWGWEPAWEWFKAQFGAEFKPGVTREQLQSVIESFPDDYDSVEVPEESAL